MKICKTHQVDKGDTQSGNYDFQYEYHLYEFSENGQKLIARSYLDETQEAHLIRLERDGDYIPCHQVLNDDLVIKAVEHLRGDGNSLINYLDENELYVELND